MSRAARIGSWVTTADEPNKLVRRCEGSGGIIICHRDRSQPPGQRWRWTRRDGPGGTVLAEGAARTAADAWYDGATNRAGMGVAQCAPEGLDAHADRGARSPAEPGRRAMTTRTRLLTIRLSPAEHSAAAAYARARNVPLSELVRTHLASLADPTPPAAAPRDPT